MTPKMIEYIELSKSEQTATTMMQRDELWETMRDYEREYADLYLFLNQQQKS